MGSAAGRLKIIAPPGGAVVVNMTLPSGNNPTVYTDQAVTQTTTWPLTVPAGVTSTYWFAQEIAVTLSVTYGGKQIADPLSNTTQSVVLGAGQTLVRDYSAFNLALAGVQPAARVFNLDFYGADNTGVATSDAAWVAAYAAAVAAVTTHGSITFGGAIISAGSGIYRFTTGVVKISDPRVGLVGQGVGTTVFITTSSSGILINLTNTLPALSYVTTAPCGGFTVNGASVPGGGTVTGLVFGDRSQCNNRAMRAEYFNTSATSRGFLFRNDNGGLVEESTFTLSASNCVISFDFDGNNGSSGSIISSFDYNTFDLSVITGTIASVSPIVLRLTGAANIIGSFVKLRGNVAAAAAQTATLMQIGTGTDASFFSNNFMDVVAEADGGTCVDLNTGTNALFNDNTGKFYTINISSSWSAGTMNGYAAVGGRLSSPIFATAGTLTKIGGQISEWESGVSTVNSSFGQALTMDMTGGHLATPVTAGTPTSSGVTSGTANTVTVTGGDTAGTIQVVTPGSGVVTGTQATVTFHTVFAAAPKSVLIFPANAATAGVVANWFVPSPATTSAWILSAVAAPAISTTYLWRYLVLG